MMVRMFLNLLLTVFCFGLCKSQGFIADQKCVYQKLGVTSDFSITPNVDFYIPHNWVNNDDNRNYLHMNVFSRHVVLRHPSSSDGNPNEIKLPLEDMKIGWNRLYLKKDGNILQIIEKSVKDNSIKIIQSFVIQPAITFPNQEVADSLFVTGLHSLVECNKDLNTRYYKIPAGESVKIPYVMFKQVDRFDAYSESHPFSFEITLSGKRRQICWEEKRDAPDVYNVPRDCRHWPVNNFTQDTTYNIYMYPASYDNEYILKYNDFTFTDFELHNIGNTDFYIRTFIKPDSNAPISLLNDSLPALPAVKPTTSSITITTTTATASPKDTTTVVPVIPLEKGCGINSKKDIFNRIYGGVTANGKDWPWMVAFVKSSDGVSETHECGGVLINERVVLTAASCFYYKNTYDDVKARLGEYDFDTHEEGNHVDFEIVAVAIHENYQPEANNDDDIAMVKLGSSTGEAFPPACLPPSSMNWEDQFGYITGWGKQNFEGENSNQLREAFVKIWKKTECDVAYPKEITDNMLCAGGRDGKGSCEGDTGGPLVSQILPDTRWYVVGIDSWGGFGCDSGLPTVYTKVDKYLEWIKLNI